MNNFSRTNGLPITVLIVGEYSPVNLSSGEFDELVIKKKSEPRIFASRKKTGVHYVPKLQLWVPNVVKMRLRHAAVMWWLQKWSKKKVSKNVLLTFDKV